MTDYYKILKNGESYQPYCFTLGVGTYPATLVWNLREYVALKNLQFSNFPTELN